MSMTTELPVAFTVLINTDDEKTPMVRKGVRPSWTGAILLLLILGFVQLAQAQLSGPPTANCHITDGTFTACPNGQAEWSDVQPLAFHATNSFLYVNQDAAHSFLYLLYDFPSRTAPLGPTESVQVNFSTVSPESGVPAFEKYKISIFANGQIQVVENGQTVTADRIAGTAGFGPSPNSAVPHLIAELQVPLTPGTGTVYSPDPLFWSASPPPPTPTPPPSPSPTPTPDPCPTDPGKTYNRCVKADLNNAQANATQAAIACGLAGALCSTPLGIPICGPAEIPLLIQSALFASLAAEIGRKLGGDPPGVDFTVPPDPNFTVIAQPATYSLSIPTSGLTAQEADAFNALAVNMQQLIALEQAETTALAREEGASLAGNTFWVNQQMQAARKFGGQAGVLYSQLPELQANIGAAFKAAGIQFTFTPNDVLTFLAEINPNSPPSEQQQQFVLAQNLVAQQLGISAANQALILPLLSSADPLAVEILGTGTFPASLSDPVIAATFKQLGAGLTQSAPSLFLMGTDAVSFHRDSTFAGQLWAHLGGNVAYVNDFGVRGVTTVDGRPVTGFSSVPPSLSDFSGLFFASPGTCCNDPATDASLGIATNASAIASFMAGSGGVAIEDFQGAPAWDSILGFSAAPGVTFGGSFPICSDPAVSTAAGVAAGFIGNGAGPNTYVDGCFIHQAYSDSFFAAQGFTSLMDASNLPSGSGVVLQKGSTGGPVLAPGSAATAALVQTNVNGDTVVDLRGVAPTDAPTLQDQIFMVVQSRIIQNPSLSAIQLTTQLVNSLPSSILPPDQAQAIIDAVTSALVPPPAVISGMPGSGCSLWPPNHKLVQVATVTAADAVGGVLPGSFTVTGTSNEPSNDPSDPEIVITPDGLGGFIVQLQADRLGTGTGRIYTITTTASNTAGLATISTATCTVPHDQGQN